MDRKHCYEVAINSLAKKQVTYSYDYASNRGKDIRISLSHNAAYIKAELTKLYSIDEITSPDNRILTDAIKKSLLLHLILFGTSIRMNKVEITIDGKEKSPEERKGIGVYSLINESTKITLPESWSNPTMVKELLSTPPSKQDRRWAALFAALCAKSHTYETEKFIYNWMAFNGIYGYFAEMIQKTNNKQRNKRTNESTQLTWLLQLFDIGKECVSRNDSTPIAQKVISLLRRCDTDIIRYKADVNGDLEKGILKNLKETVDGKPYDITAYGYLLVCFAYYYRCNVIHADRPVALFSYEEEIDIKCLSLINALLGEFIDQTLPVLFDHDYLRNKYQARINAIAR